MWWQCEAARASFHFTGFCDARSLRRILTSFWGIHQSRLTLLLPGSYWGCVWEWNIFKLFSVQLLNNPGDLRSECFLNSWKGNRQVQVNTSLLSPSFVSWAPWHVSGVCWVRMQRWATGKPCLSWSGGRKRAVLRRIWCGVVENTAVARALWARKNHCQVKGGFKEKELSFELSL